MRRTVYYPSKPAPEGYLPVPEYRAMEQPKSSSLPDVTYHVKAGILVGILVAVAIFVFLALAFNLDLMIAARFAGVAGAVVGGYVGIRWTLARTTHDIRTDEAERRRRWQVEDRETSFNSSTPAPAEPAAPAAPAAPAPILGRGYELDRLARLLIEREFVDKLSTTREECEADGFLTQADWNKLNEVLHKAGIKSGRRWVAGTWEEAALAWRQHVTVDGGHFYIHNGNEVEIIEV